ncbi:hypothetical protein Emed_006504 [Eimeria media]
MQHDESPANHLWEQQTIESDVTYSGVLAPSDGVDENLSVSLLWRNLHKKTGAFSPAAKVLLFLFLALAVTSLCRTLPKKIVAEGLSQRKLAEEGLGGDLDDDEELNSILEQCLEMEEQNRSFFAAAITTPPSQQAPSTGDAVAISQQVQGFAAKGLHAPIGAASQWGWMPGEVPFGAPYFVGPQVEAGGATASELLSSSELMALHPDAWLDTIPSIEAEWIAAGETGGTVGGGDGGPSTSASVFEEPKKALLTTGVSSSSMQTQETLKVQGTEEGAASGSPSAQPSTSDDLRQLLTHTSHDETIYENHPFVRLPRILPGAIRRQLNPELASRGLAGSAYQCLASMRELFLKPKLNAFHVENLLTTVESLIYHVRHKMSHRRKGDSPRDAVAKYALYFLICDAIVCARELLGPAMVPELWWDDFFSRIDISFVPAIPRIKRLPAVAYNLNMVDRLRNAVRICKTGIRPSKQEVLELKRLLFFSPHKPENLSRARWNAWRNDDREFRESSESLEKENKGEQQDQD